MASSLYSTQQLKVLFENSRDAVFFMRKLDEDYEYLYANAAAKKLIQQPLIGQTLTECVSDANETIIRHYYNAALETAQQMVFEDYTYQKDVVIKHESTAIPVFDGENQYVLAITREVAFDRELQDKYLFIYAFDFFQNVFIHCAYFERRAVFRGESAFY